MKLWKNLSNRLDAVADVMAAKPCMQGCVGKTLLSIPRTPGNLITAVILAIGLLITIGRFGFGLGAVTNLDDNNPWGIWIAFDLLCGVALAAGGYVTSSACYLFGMKRYHSAVRPAILTAFLGYAFVVVALLYDGVVLSTMHQSSLGALFLIAPSKMHPLWYSPFMPVFFFISSMVAGLSMVIFEGTLSHKALHNKMDETHLREADGVVFGFGRAASFVLIGYFIIKVLDTTMDNDWHYLASGYGAWFAVEMVGFVLLPAFLYALGVREKNITLIRVASVFGVLGIVVNRFNVCLVAFNWQLDSADRYFPSISEVFLSIFIVTLIVTAYRFVCSKMPVLYEHPDFKDAH